MPLNTSGRDWSGELILMLLSTLIKEMNFIRCGNGNSRINGNVGNWNSDNSLIVILELFDLGFGEKAHDKQLIDRI